MASVDFGSFLVFLGVISAAFYTGHAVGVIEESRKSILQIMEIREKYYEALKDRD